MLLRRLFFFIDKVDKVANFSGYGKCIYGITLDKDSNVLGIEHDLSISKVYVDDCLRLVPVMNHFKQIYREGMTPSEIAEKMNPFLVEMVNQQNIAIRQQQEKIAAENQARAYQEEQDRLILSSQQGVGLRVYNKASPYITGFVDAVANGKIRIILPNNQVIWDYAENWLISR
ncbi:MAG: hypothetical protein MR556_00925 [Succinatimonas sp.]|nr:hypothetical protein [Succinatimonas sp.]